jgi:hypothetical protein
MSIQDLIAQARAEAEAPPTEENGKYAAASVIIAGRKVQLGFTKMLGAEWSALTVIHPPRKGAVADASVGFDFDAVAGKYPAAHITVDGEHPTVEEWAELYGLMETPWRNTVQMKLFDLHQSGPARQLLALGKVSSGAGSRKKRN